MTALLALVGLSGNVRGDDTSDCIVASEAAQSLRDDHALLEAREKFGVCSRIVCPGPIRSDCVRQRLEVEEAIPTVVLRATTAGGQDAADVRILCDGVPFASKLDGRAHAVNPGVHTFRFEEPGQPPVERRVVVDEGEKNRLVIAEIVAERSLAAPQRLPLPSAPSRRAPLLVPGLVAGGIGLAAAVPMAILWISATDDIHVMRMTCATTAGGAGCPAERVNVDRTKLVIGDALMGVAVAGVATGTLLLLPNRSSSGSIAGLRLMAWPTPSGAAVTAWADF